MFLFTEIGNLPIDFYFYVSVPDAAINLTDIPGGPKITVDTVVVNLKPESVIVGVAGIPIKIV